MLTLVLSGCSASQWERNLRFGWPTGATKQATRMRVLWTWTGVTALALGVVVWGLIFWCCIRYRKKSDELPRQTKYNFVVEAICFTFPFIVIAGLFYRTVIVEDYVNHLSKNPDVKVQVDAFKWNWKFEYHQYRVNDAVTPTNEVFPTAAGATPSSTPNYLATSGSSTEIPVLVVPVNKTVQIDEHSLDVLHSFWVPEFLFKRDVVPYGGSDTDTSHDNKFEFTATTKGRYVGRCAELCGTYHSQMNFEVRVVSVTTFNKYMAALKTLSPADPGIQHKALAMAGMPAYATTTYPFDTDTKVRSASQNGQEAGN
jgi:cytochrome c oxidase subunit 2